jgi:tetratricopeptide (TPR) repeat protein
LLKSQSAWAHFNTANVLFELKRYEEALAGYDQALEIQPDFAQALSNRGNVLFELKRHEEALASYDQALEIQPDFAQALSNRGNVLFELKRYEEALASCEGALAIQPDFAQALSNRGNVLFELKRYEEALAGYDQALAIQPDFAQTISNRGNVLFELKRYEEALAGYDQALAIQPDFAQALSNRGNVLFKLKRYEEALASYDLALAIRSDLPEAHHGRGTVLGTFEFKRYEEALASYDRALAIRPDFAEAYHGRGTLLRIAGRIEEARPLLEKAVKLAPRRVEFVSSLADFKRFVHGDPNLPLIEALARDMGSLSEEDQIQLHFALGKVYADLGQHERSFSHLIAGNALKREQIVYDEAGALAQIERMRDVFTAKALRKARGFGDPSPVPIFIIGMPRSGTTLVEQILATHPKVYGAGELNDFQAAVASLLNRARTGLGAEELGWISTRYLERVRAIAPAAERITDKMPANFRYVGLIHLVLPNARIIHIRRDPIDTCLSCFSILFAHDQLFTYDLAELGRYYRAYAMLMEHWREVLPLEQILEIQYEELVVNFEGLARRIVAHCGLEWDDACLDFHNTQRPIWTASMVQVRQPIYPSSVGRWRPHEAILRTLRQALEGD